MRPKLRNRIIAAVACLSGRTVIFNARFNADGQLVHVVGVDRANILDTKGFRCRLESGK